MCHQQAFVTEVDRGDFPVDQPHAWNRCRQLLDSVLRADPDRRRAVGQQRRIAGAERAVPAGAVDRKSTRLNSSHYCAYRMPSSACKKKNYKSLIQLYSLVI